MSEYTGKFDPEQTPDTSENDHVPLPPDPAPDQPNDQPAEPSDTIDLTSGGSLSPLAFDEGEIDPEVNRVPQELSASQGVSPAILEISIRSPGKYEFFQTHPSDTLHYTTVLLEVQSGFDRIVYLVAPHLRDMFPEAMMIKTLFFCVGKDGTPFLWPIRLLLEGDKDERYARTAREIAQRAKTQWLRIVNNPKIGWVPYPARGDLGKPQWPNVDLKTIINRAFKGRYITDSNHPVFRELRGEL